MVKALFDTNILIDYLKGIDAAKHELERYATRSISLITWMEVLVGATSADYMAIRSWLKSFDLIAIDTAVADRAVAIQQATGIRLPDAIVWASAQMTGKLLVSRNRKDFPPDEPGVRMPYLLI